MTRSKAPVIGQRFGYLTVLAEAPSERPGRRLLCQCDCGEKCVCLLNNLRRRPEGSCGCRQALHAKTLAKTYIQTHGQSFTRTYRAWVSMKSRCLVESDPSFRNYGGRGISIFEEWIHDFPAFSAYMGPQPEGGTLDRIDNSGNYEPGNVRWASMKQQARNKRGNFVVSLNGEEMCLSQACEVTGAVRHVAKRHLKQTGEFKDMRLPDLHDLLTKE